LFLDEGIIHGANCFAKLPHAGSCQNYTGKLLAGFEAEGRMSAGESPLPDCEGNRPRFAASDRAASASVNLKCSGIQTDLSGPEIAVSS